MGSHREITASGKLKWSRRRTDRALSELPEWKRKAATLFPDLHDSLEEDDANIYTVFFALLPRCQKAHKNSDIRFELARIYEYAAWCFRHEEYDLSNAAGVAFYEHLADEPEMLDSIPQWLEPDIFEGMSGLFESRMSEVDFQRLRDRYAKRG